MNVENCDYGHDYEDDGICTRCQDYDEDYDESLEEEEDEPVEVATRISGRTTFLDKKWLDRAKALIREKKVTIPEEAFVIAEILEEEMDKKPFDKTVANYVVIALRETEDEREVMATRLAQIRAKKTEAATEPEPVPESEPEGEHEGGRGLEAVKVTARKGRRRHEMLKAMQTCMIPDCGCDGTPHP